MMCDQEIAAELVEGMMSCSIANKGIFNMVPSVFLPSGPLI